MNNDYNLLFGGDRDYKKYIKNIKFMNGDVKFNKDNTVIISNKDGRSVKAEYKLIGIYDMVSSVFYWGYCLNVNRTKTNFLKKIIDYPNEIMKKNEVSNLDDAHYYYTKNPLFILDHKKLEDVIKLALYITNYDKYTLINIDERRIECLAIDNILQNK